MIPSTSMLSFGSESVVAGEGPLPSRCPSPEKGAVELFCSCEDCSEDLRVVSKWEDDQ